MSKRTYIYVDGFNLFYGALKNTPYKWLDLKKLFELLLTDNTILKIKYFTARISSRPKNEMAPNDQNTYLRALKTLSEVEIFYGHYLTHHVNMPLASNPKNLVKVIKNEEKGSDVNLAVHLLNDAWLDRYDCAVLVSNDSDLAEAIKLVKHKNGKKIGIITPGHPKKRKTSRELRKHADFLKRIREGALKKAQFPKIIKPDLFKPKSW